MLISIPLQSLSCQARRHGQVNKRVSAACLACLTTLGASVADDEDHKDGTRWIHLLQTNVYSKASQKRRRDPFDKATNSSLFLRQPGCWKAMPRTFSACSLIKSARSATAACDRSPTESSCSHIRGSTRNRFDGGVWPFLSTYRRETLAA